jgi:hypothetical protein
VSGGWFFGTKQWKSNRSSVILVNYKAGWEDASKWWKKNWGDDFDLDCKISEEEQRRDLFSSPRHTTDAWEEKYAWVWINR